MPVIEPSPTWVNRIWNRCFENPDYQKVKLSNSALDFSAEDDGPKARAEPSQTQLAPSALSLALVILGRAEQVGLTDHKRV
jgi:hypothetical protein